MRIDSASTARRRRRAASVAWAVGAVLVAGGVTTAAALETAQIPTEVAPASAERPPNATRWLDEKRPRPADDAASDRRSSELTRKQGARTAVSPARADAGPTVLGADKATAAVAGT